MSENMRRICLRYRLSEIARAFKFIEVPDSADIRDILPRIHANGMAKWNIYWGIVENYRTSGRLEDGATYNLISDDYSKTRKSLEGLESL